MKNKILLFLLLSFTITIVACSKPKETISGEVDATEIDIGVKVPGRIAEIFITEGQSVKKGDILGRLEGKELDAKLKTVNAALSEAQDQYVLAEKTYNRIKEDCARKEMMM